MRVPVSWLGEFVDLTENVTPEQMHDDLVRVGFEEESIRTFDVTGPVVVGQVLECESEEHSNGKVINWCQVRVALEGQRAADGGEDVRGIVCGAHNFDVGDKVVVALPGAELPGDFVISARKTYGHVSDGMIASQRELGLGDDHEGIIVLRELGLDPEVGEDAIALLGLDDQAVEINVTPDRGYALSIRGVARELSHSTGAPYRDPALAVTAMPASGFSLSLNDESPIRGEQGCHGFIARLVRGVNPQAPTPPWMIARLTLAGIRSLGLAIDISNYVMLELGNPIHAYDFDKLTGGITVRRAAAGETLETLDGQVRKLHPEDLLITDDSGPIGLAGVMGGESTKTADTTSNILVEAALFDPVSIARTARRHKLTSEASRRFERGIDPLVGRAAAQRMVDLLIELGGGTEDHLGAEILPEVVAPTITLALNAAEKLVGVDYTEDEVRDALTLIGCDVRDAGDTKLEVVPPSWRTDLTRAEDLIEEIARIVGYDRIPSTLPVAPSGRGLTRSQRLRRRSAESLTAAGFQEVLTYPFVSAAENDRFGAAVAATTSVPAVKLANPLDDRFAFLRLSLVPGLAHAAHRNISRGQTDLALIEFGTVFHPQDVLGTGHVPPLAERPSEATLVELNESIPAQPHHAAVLLTGNVWGKQPGLQARPVDWADALDAAHLIAASVHTQLVVRQGSHQAFHPGRTAELYIETDAGLQSVGFAGELLPEIAQELHFRGRVALAELDLSLLIEHAPREATIEPLSTFPAATQDLTLVVANDVAAADVQQAVIDGCGDLLEHIVLVDDYRGSGLEETEKALTFALRFRAPDRTLTADEASEAKLDGVATAASLGAKLRD